MNWVKDLKLVRSITNNKGVGIHIYQREDIYVLNYMHSVFIL